MKSSKRAGLIIGIVILLAVAGGLVVFMTKMMSGGHSGINFGFNTTVSTNLVHDEEYELEPIKKISVKADAADVNVEAKEDAKEIEVKIFTGDNMPYDVKQNDGVLEIELKKTDCGFICWSTETSVINVIVPESYAGDLYMNLDAGDVKIGELKNSNISMDMDAGDVEVKDSKDLRIKSDTGDIDIIHCGGILNIESDAGDVKIDALDLTGDSSIILDTGDIEIKNVGDIKVEAKKSIGDVDISGGNPKAENVLTIKVDVGNIEVD